MFPISIRTMMDDYERYVYVFDGDGRFTGQVIDMTTETSRLERHQRSDTISTNTMLRYNILLEAFTKTRRDW